MNLYSLVDIYTAYIYSPNITVHVFTDSKLPRKLIQYLGFSLAKLIAFWM